MKKIIVILTVFATVAIHTEVKAFDKPSGLGVLKVAEYGGHEMAELQMALLGTRDVGEIINPTQERYRNLANDHCLELFGVGLEEVVNGSVEELLPADFKTSYKVQYFDAKGDVAWFSRAAKVTDERGLSYKGVFWVDSYCWNLLSPTKKTVKIPNPPAKKEDDDIPDFHVVKESTTWNVDNSSSVKMSNFGNASISNVGNPTVDVDINFIGMQPAVEKQVEFISEKKQDIQPRERIVYREEHRCFSGCGHQQVAAKKPFFNTTGGRILSHLAAAGIGYGVGRLVDNNQPSSPTYSNTWRPSPYYGPGYSAPGEHQGSSDPYGDNDSGGQYDNDWD